MKAMRCILSKKACALIIGGLLFLFGLPPRPVACAPRSAPELYYARFTIVTINGMVTASYLDLLPVEHVYQVQEFRRFRVSGSSNAASTPDITSAAQSNAIIQLLTTYGLKSIHGRGRLQNSRADDHVHMYYEGVLQYPLRVIDANITGAPARCQMEIEVGFSPIAFPDQWALLSFKRRLRDGIRFFLSLLYLDRR